jgi:rhodanese-related sulfurtransferase
MKKWLVITVIVTVLIVGGIIYSNNNKVTDVKGTTSSNAQTLTETIASDNGQLIDVRTLEEYASSHATGAINVPLAEIQAGNYSKIDKNKAVYVYCRSGNRAGQAKTILEQAGYKNVTNVGGLDDWQSQGGKVCSTSNISC